MTQDDAAILTHINALAAPMRNTEWCDGLIEIAHTAPNAADPNCARLFSLDETEAAAAFAAHCNAERSNVYIGASLRVPDAARNRRASGVDFYAAAFAFCEADEGADQVASRLVAAGAPAAMRISTGTIPEARVHHWVPLREPCDDPDTYADAVASLVAHVGADPRAVGAERILRLGGTVNWVNAPAKRAKGYVTEVTRVGCDDVPAVDNHRIEGLEPLPGCTPGKGSRGRGAGGHSEALRDADGKIIDGREGWWRSCVMTAIRDWQTQHGADPSDDELFAKAVARFDDTTAGDDRWRSVRGRRALRSRSDNALRRLRDGRLAFWGLASLDTGINAEAAAEAQLRRDKVYRERCQAEAPAGLPSGYRWTPTGIHSLDEDRDGEEKATWLCSPLRVLSLPRDRSGQGWGRLVEVNDPDGQVHRWAIPAELFAGDGTEVRAGLLRLGADLASGPRARAALSDLLQRWRPDARAVTTDRLGWSDDRCVAFALGDGTVLGADDVVYQHEHVPAAAS
ncbi:MAG: DUF927 domain-containing protein, partial [Pseudomonadota bacterium]